MVVVDVLLGAVTFGSVVAMTVMLWIGVLAAIGSLTYVRCDECGRLMLRASAGTSGSCPHCRHARLLHSLHVAHLPTQH